MIKSINLEKRLVTVITNTLTDEVGNPIADHQGDVIDVDNLEEVFIKSFARGGEGMGDEMHDETSVVDVVQHFTLSCDERVALGFGAGPALGIAKLYVRDDDLWEKTKSGERPEVSIAGDGERFPL